MSKTDAEETVGYRNPPKHTRFPKGRSGNPRGRPRRARDVDTLLLNLLNSPLDSSKGQHRRVSQREVVLRKILDDALAGDAKSMKIFFQMMREYDEKYLKIDPVRDGPLFTKEEMKERFARIRRRDFPDLERTTP